MKVSMASQEPSSLCRRKHDLMAPLCNIRAFTEELRYVAESLDKVVEEHREILSDSLSQTLKKLAEDDIRVCTDALGRASDSLGLQIDELFPNASTEE